MTTPRALQRALMLFDHLTLAESGLTFSTIARLLGTNDASTARLLEALASSGHLQKDHADGRWRAGPALRRLTEQAIGSELYADRFRRLARPFVEECCRQTNSTSLLILDTGDHMLVLDRCQHEDSLALQPPGRLADNWRQPPWGWLFRPVAQLARLPGAKDPSLALIRGELRRLATRGWVLRQQADRHRLAAPVHDAEGRTIAALAVGGTPASLSASAGERVGDRLAILARSLSAVVGGKQRWK